MNFSTLATKLLLLQIYFLFPSALGITNKNIPTIVVTWDYLEATQKGKTIHKIYIINYF